MLNNFLCVAITKTLGPQGALDLPICLTHTVRASSFKANDWALNLSKMNIEGAKQPGKLVDKLVDVRKLLGVEKTSTPGRMEIGTRDPHGSLNKREN